MKTILMTTIVLVLGRHTSRLKTGPATLKRPKLMPLVCTDDASRRDGTGTPVFPHPLFLQNQG
jgi:hypothetical protein